MKKAEVAINVVEDSKGGVSGLEESGGKQVAIARIHRATAVLYGRQTILSLKSINTSSRLVHHNLASPARGYTCAHVGDISIEPKRRHRVAEEPIVEPATL